MGDFRLFSGQASLVYMNHAGISPPSAVVKRAVANMLADYGKRGASAYPTWAAQRDRLRGKLAALIGASPDEVALTHNTSRGIGDVAMGLSYAPGDRIVVFDGEFPANVTPWQRAAQTLPLLPGPALKPFAGAGLVVRAQVRQVGFPILAFQDAVEHD